MLARGLLVGCGQCMRCRINKRREWTTRQLLESFTHEENCFVTLTYDEPNLPSEGVLPLHLQAFMKRFRKALSDRNMPPVRFFGCGEYGEKTIRPHYHLSLFGAGLAHGSLIQKSWNMGMVHLMEFNVNTAAYICGYVTKKMTKTGPEGKNPEFARMSLKPALGQPALAVIVNAIHTDPGAQDLIDTGDVPREIKMGNKSMPLGRTLRAKLREEIAMPEHMKENVKRRWAAESTALVKALRQEHDPDYHDMHEAMEIGDYSLAYEYDYDNYTTDDKFVGQLNEQHDLNLKSKHRIQQQRRTL